MRSPLSWLLLAVVACNGDGGVKVYNTDPTARITSPPDESTYVEGDTIVFSGVVSDGQDDPSMLGVTWSTDAQAGWSVTSIPDGSGNVEVATSSLPPGNWTITLTAVDSDDATGSDYVAVTVEDLQEEPVVTWIHPQSGESGVEGVAFTFKVQVSDAQDDPTSLEVDLSSDVDGSYCTIVPDGAGIAECDAVLSRGEHHLTATVTDLDGYAATAEAYFEVGAADDQDVDGDGWTVTQGDCNDADPSVHPGATEEENGVDDDCDGVTDEDTYAWDDDGDCSCESPSCAGSVNAECTSVAGYDCDDGDDTVYRGAPELCDGLDNDCDTEVDEGTYCVDDDGDGYAEGDGDCDDGNGAIYPGATERADGVDNDCDGSVDEGTAAYDDDGDCSCETGPCSGSVSGACSSLDDGDCNDANSSVSPGATELCNGIDDDCDGVTDEADASGAPTWYLDLDGDGYGTASRTTAACSAPAGYVANSSDCDDGDAATNPAGAETCDGTDEDCDGAIDEAGAAGERAWYSDVDGDTYGDPAVSVDACAAPAGFVADDTDCDDRDSGSYPGGEEVCNGQDDDCDGAIDEGGALAEGLWYLDADGDGYGDASVVVSSCTAPAGYVDEPTDCDDGDPYVSPDAREVCDGIDDNCDGAVDEAGAEGETWWYLDADSDTWGDTSAALLACDAPEAYVADDGDCDDEDDAIYPYADETCNGADDDCDGTVDEDDAIDTRPWYQDADADGYGTVSAYVVTCDAPTGYVASATDCNDGDAGVSPAATEVCDGVDQDCDGSVDDGTRSTWYRDADSDGYGTTATTSVACTAPAGYVADATDCNDGAASVHPGADETCNSADDDCDGATDESAVDAVTWYRDTDADGYGNAASTTAACTAPSGYVANSADCDDAARGVYPGAAEVCDSTDQDCDGSVDEGVTSTYYRDADGDTYGSASTTTTGCSAPSGYTTNSLDCDDASAAVKPGATEYCNSRDDDCDGATDEAGSADATVWYVDADGDSYGTTTSTTTSCSRPSGYASTATDCNDAVASINPAGTEVCDGVDQDCDSVTDDGVTTTYYRDADGDGYGTSSTTSAACSAPTGYVSNSSDCNDASASINPTTVWYRDSDGDGYGSSSSTTTSCTQPSGYVSAAGDCNDGSSSVKPGAAETCNSVDDDCDGSTDEGVLNTYYRDADGDGYGSPSITTTGCSAPTGYVSNNSDCNDGDASRNPATVWYRDADGDGYGTSSYTSTSCNQPSGYVSNSTDCNDGSSSIKPSATESCDGVDNDCDSSTDEAGATGCTTYYYDADNDGYGTSTSSCLCATSGSYRATASGDCQDSNSNVKPNQTTYYSTSYSTTSGGTSFDYNCNGSEEERYAGGGICHVSGFSCDQTSGFIYSSSTPGCGSAGDYVTSCTYYVVYCGEVTTRTTQTCR